MLGNPPAYQDVFDYAESNDVQAHIAALNINSPHINKPVLWPELKQLSEAVKIDNSNLCVSKRGDLMTELSMGIADYLQFPESTIFLHGLGCVAAASSKSFKFQYGPFDELPVNLYVITAQPPSTGKSHVNNRFFSPIRKAYDELNSLHEDDRDKLKREIKRLERELEKAKDDMQESEIVDQIKEKSEKLKLIPEWNPFVTNTTPEGIEEVLNNNNGLFGIVSAEAEAISVAVGNTYQSDGKSNFEVLLKAWDGEYFSSSRVTRKGFKGEASGSICVLAQDDTIDSMLMAAAQGRGLPERFLLLSEPSMLGYRDHSKPYKFNKNLYERYKSLVKNIIFEKDIVLNFDQESETMIQAHKMNLEPLMRDDSEYSHNLFTGFIGKADKQVRKLACVLHIIDNWQDGGDRSRTVSADHVNWAIGLFDALMKTFVNAADYLGYVGTNSEIQKVITVISDLAAKNKLKITFTQLRDAVRNVKPFKGSRNIAKRLKEEVVPQLESMNYCLFDGSTIYINPRLK